MISFPDISPEIFSFNLLGLELALRWYALAYIVGFVIAGILMKFLLKRKALWKFATPPMDYQQVDAVLTFLILGVILGGRLGYVLFYNFEFYLENPINILRLWDGGMSFHGGFIGVVIAVIFYSRSEGIPLLSMSDLIAVCSPPGLFLGRLANFTNAELWGRPTQMPWGVVFPGERAQSCLNIEGLCARHPSQLYEAALEGLLLFLILLILVALGRLKKPGIITGVFMLGYGISRYCVEFFREPDQQFLTDQNPFGFAITVGDFGATMGQLLSLPMIFIGVTFILIGNRRHRVS